MRTEEPEGGSPDAAVQPVEMADAELLYLPRLELGRSPDGLLQTLIDTVPWAQRELRLYGRSIPQPRLTAWYGDPGAGYRYSGMRLDPEPWTPLLLDIRRRVEEAAGARFNSVLLNYYRDHRDSVGLHSDDEPELGCDPVIASLSLGAERRLLFRHRRPKSAGPVRMALASGSLLLMRGPTQRNWRHGIEKERLPCGPRINLSFRRIVAVRRGAVRHRE